ncbi:radical SAM protein [Nanoarchaeota archaeon]
MTFNQLLNQANKTFKENFPNKVWYGRCIFLSWYCELGTCKFCFRSTIKHKIKHAQKARRSLPSIITEALLCKNLGWRIEFLTGGYKIFPFKEIVHIAKTVKEVYGEKIWVNLGQLTPKELQQLKPYVKGIVASIETINKPLHDQVCPDKPIEPYSQMLKKAKDFQKSITIVIGLGEKPEHLEELHNFIEEHQLDRITFYALKPVQGTPYKKGPETDYYAEWIAKTRIRFPKLEIIAGTTAQRYKEVKTLIKAGANAFTKFPATKIFNSPEAKSIEKQIKPLRTFTSTLTKLPKIDWHKQIDQLNIEKDLKDQVKITLNHYLKKMSK